MKTLTWLCYPLQLVIDNGFHHSYSQTSDMNRTLLGDEIGDHSDVVGAAPTTSSLSTYLQASMDQAMKTARGNEKHLSFRLYVSY